MYLYDQGPSYLSISIYLCTLGSYLPYISQVPELEILNVNRPSNTKLRLQVKQARLPIKMTVAMGLHIYYNEFSVTGTIYVQDL